MRCSKMKLIYETLFCHHISNRCFFILLPPEMYSGMPPAIASVEDKTVNDLWDCNAGLLNPREGGGSIKP